MKLVYLFFLWNLSLFSNELVLTIPKTGTNLVIKCVKLITGKEDYVNIKDIQADRLDDTFFWGHYWLLKNPPSQSFAPTPERLALCKKHDLKIILSLRDPKGLVAAISRRCFGDSHPTNLFKVIDRPGKFLNEAAGGYGFDEYSNFTECYMDYLKWVDEYPNVYVTSFEKLVGEKGGGDREIQIQEIQNLADFLDRSLSYEEACAIADKLFGGTSTFKKGQCNQWKEEFSPELLEAFNLREGALAVNLGYEYQKDLPE